MPSVLYVFFFFKGEENQSCALSRDGPKNYSNSEITEVQGLQRQVYKPSSAWEGFALPM